jgi:hypothetical protein
MTQTEQNDEAQTNGTFGGLSDSVIQNFRNVESVKHSTHIAQLNVQNLYLQKNSQMY